jgi:hypothetical protein
MEAWRKCFRGGFAPVLPRAGLERLRDLLRRNDRSVIQGNTTAPVPMTAVLDWPVEGACPVGQCGIAAGCETVGEVDAWFTAACKLADALLGEPAGCRFFPNWVDDTPWDEMRRELLAEVERCLRLGIHAREASHVQRTEGADECLVVGVGH